MNHAFLVNERHSTAPEAFSRPDSVRAAPAAKAAPDSSVRDTAAVDVRNWHSMQYWARWLGISEQQLMRLIRVAGTNVATIEAHLAERRARRRRKRAAAEA
jgi:Protein of unknown function (DUF3606)